MTPILPSTERLCTVAAMKNRSALCLIVAASAAMPASARADQEVVASPTYRFSTPTVTMAQGERLTFRNTDVAGHDVTARDSGPDNKPLFSTPIIGTGESAFVEGSQYLRTGSYAFLCSIHPQMTGTLTVTADGSPVARPTPGAPAVADTTRPAASARILSRRMTLVRRSGAILARVTVDEAATVTLRAVSRPRAGGPLVTVARARVELPAAGTRRVTMVLTSAGRRAVRGRKRLAVLLTARAVDRAGNARSVTTGRTLGA